MINPFELSLSESGTIIDNSIVEEEDTMVIEEAPNEAISEPVVSKDTSTNEVTVSQATPPRRRGRPPGSKNKVKANNAIPATNPVIKPISLDDNKPTLLDPKPVDYTGKWDPSSFEKAIATFPDVLELSSSHTLAFYITNKFMSLCHEVFITKSHNSIKEDNYPSMIVDAVSIIGQLISIWKSIYAVKYWEALSSSSVEAITLKDKEARTRCHNIDRMISMLEYWYDSLVLRLDFSAPKANN
jgi:hypothetical protein